MGNLSYNVCKKPQYVHSTLSVSIKDQNVYLPPSLSDEEIQRKIISMLPTYSNYIKTACESLKKIIILEHSGNKMCIKLKDPKINEICLTLIGQGRYHDNCAVRITYLDYSAKVFLYGNDRWGYDLWIHLTASDFIVLE